jgi:hypothetical protein
VAAVEVMQAKAAVVELPVDLEAVEVIRLVQLEQQAKETQAGRAPTHKVEAAAAQVVLEDVLVQVAAHQTLMQLAAERHIRVVELVHHLALSMEVILDMAVLVMVLQVEIIYVMVGTGQPVKPLLDIYLHRKLLWQIMLN